MTVTFTPFGVASEYSCRGWRPTGSSLSCVGPAIGRLILANLPPFSLSQVQTLGGTYVVDGSVIHSTPGGSRLASLRCQPVSCSAGPNAATTRSRLSAVLPDCFAYVRSDVNYDAAIFRGGAADSSLNPS